MLTFNVANNHYQINASNVASEACKFIQKKTKEWKSSSDVDWKDTSVINLLFHRLIIWRQVFWTLDIYIYHRDKILLFNCLDFHFCSYAHHLLFWEKKMIYAISLFLFRVIIASRAFFFVFKTIDRWYHRSFFSSLWHTPHIYI
jgi:hypothetical protein